MRMRYKYGKFVAIIRSKDFFNRIADGIFTYGLFKVDDMLFRWWHKSAQDRHLEFNVCFEKITEESESTISNENAWIFFLEWVIIKIIGTWNKNDLFFLFIGGFYLTKI